MPSLDAVSQTVLARERQALDRWAQGKAPEYYHGWAEDLTYFDDIGAHRCIDGGAAMRRYAASLEGKIPPHRYDMVDPRVQLYGEIGILTFRYEPFGDDGTPLQQWKATVVYRQTDDQWRVVHAHWSMVKEAATSSPAAQP